MNFTKSSIFINGLITVLSCSSENKNDKKIEKPQAHSKEISNSGSEKEIENLISIKRQFEKGNYSEAEYLIKQVDLKLKEQKLDKNEDYAHFPKLEKSEFVRFISSIKEDSFKSEKYFSKRIK